jgi:DNA repair protein RadC
MRILKYNQTLRDMQESKKNKTNVSINKLEKKYSFTGKKLRIVEEPNSPILSSPTIHCSNDSETLFRQMYDADDIQIREEFHVLFLNRANRPVGHSRISIGGISGTVADGKIIYSLALVCGASGIVLCHNHPSAQLKPSHTDIQITNALVKFGKLIDIQVLDHIILTENNYFSFADDGLLN